MTGFSSLPLAEEGGSSNHSQWAGVSKILGPRWAQLPALTIGLFGAQLIWSVEFGYASPYLLSLGLSKSLMAMVFLAGPLSGLIVQPLIGILADNSKSRFGRRRPYMLFTAFLCACALLLLGFTRGVASIFSTLGSTVNDALTIALAVLAIYCLDFSINGVQAVDRALIVDTLPTALQESGNAWAATMLGAGSVAGFFIGNIDLTSFLFIFGSTQLQILAVVSSFFFILAHATTAYMVKEKVLLSTAGPKKKFKAELREMWDTFLTLPHVIRQICIIQFFAWIAWFPVLFYTTVYIGELYKRSSPPPDSEDGAALLDAEATRLGSWALFLSSVLSLTANIIMPFFTREDRKQPRTPVALTRKKTGLARWKMHLAELWAFSHLLFALCMFATFFTSSVFGATILVTLTGFSWAITQWAPFSLLAQAILSEPSTNVEDNASILLADSRSRGSMGVDADEDEQQFLVVGDEDYEGGEGGNTKTDLGIENGGAGLESGGDDVRDAPRSTSPSLDEDENRPSPLMGNSRARVSHFTIDPETRLGGDEDGDNDDEENANAGAGVGTHGEQGTGGLRAKAGIILGIHNIFIVIPQFLVTGLSSIIFAIFEPDKSVLHGNHPGKTPPSSSPANATSIISNRLGYSFELLGREDDSIGGGMAAIAFVLCWQLAQELKHR